MNRFLRQLAHILILGTFSFALLSCDDNLLTQLDSGSTSSVNVLARNREAVILIDHNLEGNFGRLPNKITASNQATSLIQQINTAPDFIVADDHYLWELITNAPWFLAHYELVETVEQAKIFAVRPLPDNAERVPISVETPQGVTLVGYALSSKSLGPDSPATVSLFWEAVDEVTPFQTTIRLSSTFDNVTHAEVVGTTPSTVPNNYWQVGDVVEERFELTIDEDVPSGSYDLSVVLNPLAGYVTFFDQPTDDPLVLYRDGDTNALDRATLALVSVGWLGEMGAIAESLGTVLSDGIELSSAEITQDQNIVAATLYWQATATPTHHYIVFVHLLDSAGNLITNHDGAPKNGMHLTRSWQAGQLIEDTHRLTLPDNLPSGAYTLKVGLYNAETQDRVAVTSGKGANSAESTITIGEITQP